MKHKLSKSLLSIFVLSCLSFGSGLNAQAADLFVAVGGNDAGNCQDAQDPCATIQFAIDVATDQGDQINIAAGEYPENVVINKDNLTLIGAGVGQTVIIDSGDLNTSVDPVIDPLTSCKGDFHTVCNGQSTIGVLVQASNATISNVTVDGRDLNADGIVELRGGVVQDDRLFGVNGINGFNVNNVEVKNIFLHGIDAIRSLDVVIENNIIENVQGNDAAAGIASVATGGSITGNTVSDSVRGIVLQNSRQTTVSNNAIFDLAPAPVDGRSIGLVVNSSGRHGFHTNVDDVLNQAPDRIEGNTISSCGQNIDKPSIGLIVMVPTIAPEIINNTISDCQIALALFGERTEARGGVNPINVSEVGPTLFVGNQINNAESGLNVSTNPDALLPVGQGFGTSFDAKAELFSNNIALVDQSLFLDNAAGSTIQLNAQANRLIGNVELSGDVNGLSLDVAKNWWGINDIATNLGGNSELVSVIASQPNLILEILGPDSILEGEAANFVAQLVPSDGSALPGQPLPNLGIVLSSNGGALDLNASASAVNGNLTPDQSAPATFQVTAALDNENIVKNVEVLPIAQQTPGPVNPAPSFDSDFNGGGCTLMVGSMGYSASFLCFGLALALYFLTMIVRVRK